MRLMYLFRAPEAMEASIHSTFKKGRSFRDLGFLILNRRTCTRGKSTLVEDPSKSMMPLVGYTQAQWGGATSWVETRLRSEIIWQSKRFWVHKDQLQESTFLNLWMEEFKMQGKIKWLYLKWKCQHPDLREESALPSKTSSSKVKALLYWAKVPTTWQTGTPQAVPESLSTEMRKEIHSILALSHVNCLRGPSLGLGPLGKN